MSDPTTGLSTDDAAERIFAIENEPEEIQEDTPESEPSEVEEPTSESPEEVEAEAETAPEETDAEEVTAEAGETDQFLEELNELFKEDQSRFDAIKIPTKVNGVEGETSLSELLATHQIGQASEERLNSLKAEKAAFEAERAQTLETFNTQLTQATELVNLLEQQFLADAKTVNWEELRETDPAEFAAKRQELIEKQQQLQGAKSTIQQEQQAKFMENYQSAIQRESAALLETFPSWADESVAKIEKTQIRDFLLESGFQPHEVDGKLDANGNILAPGMIDHRAITLAKKAMLYDKGEKKVEVAKNKVRTLPKVVKPGKPKSSNEKDDERQGKLKGRLKKTGKLNDAAAILLERGFGG